MDKICEILKKTLHWVSLLDRPPIRWIDEDRVRVATMKRPNLEFGFHSWGSESTIRVGEKQVTTVPGTIMVMNAHFGNCGTPDDSWRYWCLALNVEKSAPLKGLGNTPLLLTAPSRNAQRLLRCYEQVRQERRHSGPIQSIRLKSAVLMLLAELFENTIEESANGSRSPSIENAIQFMVGHHTEPRMRLNDIANSVHLSVAHFGRLFKDEVGQAPMKFLSQLRVERAKALLDRADLSVGEVGVAVGFEDPLHFSRVFRSATGKSPRAYRGAAS